MKLNFAMASLMVFAICHGLVAQIETARVTEAWVGISGNADGTADWFEVTNTGDVPFDTGEIFYDDSAPSFMEGGFLESVNLMPGESAVFLTSIEADNSVDFDNSFLEYLFIWGDTGIIGIPAGGGNLGGGGDQVNLFSVTDNSTLVPIDTLEYDGSVAGLPITIERIGEGFTDVRQSVLGENGAFESNAYTDDFGVSTTIVGSPGAFAGFTAVLIGDVNCDGVVDLLDVQPFVDVITTGGFDVKADVNEDGMVDLLDVGPFVEILTG